MGIARFKNWYHSSYFQAIGINSCFYNPIEDLCQDSGKTNRILLKIIGCDTIGTSTFFEAKSLKSKVTSLGYAGVKKIEPETLFKYDNGLDEVSTTIPLASS